MNASGVVYVADSLNDRVLVFQPPLTNGMAATRLLGSGLKNPLGIELDAVGGVWVNDADNFRYRHYTNEVLDYSPGSYDDCSWGGIGVDADNNVLGAGWDWQEGIRLSSPTYTLKVTKFLQAGPEEGTINQTTARGFSGFPAGIEVTPDQLIVADNSRLVFWNDPRGLSNDKPADGVIGVANFTIQVRWGPFFGPMTTDEERTPVGHPRQPRPEPDLPRGVHAAAGRAGRARSRRSRRRFRCLEAGASRRAIRC